MPHLSYNDKTWRSYTLFKKDPKNIWITDMVEKWDPVLGHQDPRNPWDLRDSQNSMTSSTTGSMGPPGRLVPGSPGTSGPQEPWEIISTVWNSESNHQETLKLKHKQTNFPNYVIGQSKRKIACTFWGYFIHRDFIYLSMIIRDQSPPLLLSSCVTVINRNDNEA